MEKIFGVIITIIGVVFGTICCIYGCFHEMWGETFITFVSVCFMVFLCKEHIIKK
jgi:ABC-type microcin C transport system permease subunit YejE